MGQIWGIVYASYLVYPSYATSTPMAPSGSHQVPPENVELQPAKPGRVPPGPTRLVPRKAGVYLSTRLPRWCVLGCLSFIEPDGPQLA